MVVLTFQDARHTHTTSGAGISEADRPLFYVVVACFGLFGWVLGTSALFSIFMPAARLPRPMCLGAAMLVRGQSSGWSANLDIPAIASDAPRVSALRLLLLAFLELPAFLFLLPMLLGWLLQTGVYRPVEAATVAAMGVLAWVWSAFVLTQALRRSRPAPVEDHASQPVHR